MAGVLRGARVRNYDIVLASDTPEREMQVYDRFVNDNSVDGFIVDLPRENDRRVTYLLDAGRPFVVHGRDGRSEDYGWVDVDNYGNFYSLLRLLLANGHKRIAFINGDETFAYAVYRRRAVMDALADGGFGQDTVTVYNSLHPMGDAGFKLTSLALADPKVTAILYSSALMAVEGHTAVLRHAGGRNIAVATMDDELHFVDLTPLAGHYSAARSSLRDAGNAIIGELIRQCNEPGPGRGIEIPSLLEAAPGLDASVLSRPIPAKRRQRKLLPA